MTAPGHIWAPLIDARSGKCPGVASAAMAIAHATPFTGILRCPST